MKVPVLQAVAVFCKSSPAAPFNTDRAPLPTFLRKEPTTLNPEQAATAFYVNYLLKSELDRKVHGIFIGIL